MRAARLTLFFEQHHPLVWRLIENCDGARRLDGQCEDLAFARSEIGYGRKNAATVGAETDIVRA